MAAPINAILDIWEDTALYPYETEPVSLQEAKDYCKIDTTADDTLIDLFITTARIYLEKYTGLSFVPKRLTAQLQNDCGGIEIPYGPMSSPLDPSLITDSDGSVTAITTKGIKFLTINEQLNYVQIIYSAGFTILPEPLKTAIKAQVFFFYENRGERLSFGVAGVRSYSVEYVSDAARELCDPFRRVWDMMF